MFLIQSAHTALLLRTVRGTRFSHTQMLRGSTVVVFSVKHVLDKRNSVKKIENHLRTGKG